jgi:hypothetical protein
MWLIYKKNRAHKAPYMVAGRWAFNLTASLLHNISDILFFVKFFRLFFTLSLALSALQSMNWCQICTSSKKMPIIFFHLTNCYTVVILYI